MVSENLRETVCMGLTRQYGGTMETREVTCLCWYCGREILSDEAVHFVNEELWCEGCAFPDAPKDERN